MKSELEWLREQKAFLESVQYSEQNYLATKMLERVEERIENITSDEEQ